MTHRLSCERVVFSGLLTRGVESARIHVVSPQDACSRPFPRGRPMATAFWGNGLQAKEDRRNGIGPRGHVGGGGRLQRGVLNKGYTILWTILQ